MKILDNYNYFNNVLIKKYNKKKNKNIRAGKKKRRKIKKGKWSTK